MELEKYLEGKMSAINAALDSLLPKDEDYPANLIKAMRYSIFAGGKRLRPILVLASNEAVVDAGGSAPSANNNGGADGEDGAEDAMNTACAFECVHTYSLIHDDLPSMDNDDLRRGKPTCHKVFGEAAAILAGDALLTTAFEMVAATPIKDKSKLLRVIKELAHAAGYNGMVGGQIADIESEGKEISFPALEHIHIHKTGVLILAAVRAGAIIGGADEIQLGRLTVYGERIGLAFQIADDILDVEGDSVTLGKPTGSDEKRKKMTYPSLIGIKESKELAQGLADSAVNAISAFDEKALPLREIARYIVDRKR